jgi:hypothetical protein
MRIRKIFLRTTTANRLGGFFFGCKGEEKFAAARDDFLLVQNIKNLFAILAALDQARLAQDCQVMRNGRLRNFYFLRDVAHGTPVATAEAHDFLPRRISDSSPELSGTIFNHAENI